MVPKDHELRNQILDEAHSSKLSIHPGSSKIYQDLKIHFWWTKMKKEIAAYVARCDNCSRVKAIHLKSTCGGINPYTLMAKLGPARIDGPGPPKDDVWPSQPDRSPAQGVKADLAIKQDPGRLE